MRRSTWWLAVFAGPLMSILLEVLQLFFRRVPNFWDVMMNSLGYTIGFVIGTLLAPYFPLFNRGGRGEPGLSRPES